MSKKEKYVDIMVLLIIGGLFCQSGIGHFRDNYNLTINTYLGFLLWLISVYLKLRIPQRSRFLVVTFLILTTLNIISFTIASYSFGSSHLIEYKGFHFTSISLNPLAFILLCLYFVLNFDVVIKLWSKIFRPSDSESIEEFKKEEKFYYEKFVVYSNDELSIAIKNFDDYPEAAQEAINKILTERKEIN